MKNRRQELILKLIKEKQIETQEELASYIKAAGMETTQATISRDLRELEIEKVNENGVSRYAVVAKSNAGSASTLARFLTDAVRSVDFAGNLVVIKAFAGMGNAVGAAVDAMNWEDVVGTIAGDDTLLIITKSEVNAIDVTRRINELYKK